MLSYTSHPTNDFYVDAYWLLKEVVERIAGDPINAQTEAMTALIRLIELREQK